MSLILKNNLGYDMEYEIWIWNMDIKYGIQNRDMDTKYLYMHGYKLGTWIQN